MTDATIPAHTHAMLTAYDEEPIEDSDEIKANNIIGSDPSEPYYTLAEHPDPVPFVPDYTLAKHDHISLDNDPD